jgi:hypothetical protein
LNHPNIVTVYDFGEYGSQPFIVMEYVPGETMANLIRRKVPVSISDKLRWMEELCAGAGYAHQMSVVHRDIKPANLMLAKDGTIKILDMGLARSFASDKDDLTGNLGQDGDIAGTVDFVSPEQCLGQRTDERSDIYSLGATLFALIAGHPPFTGSTTQKLMQHQMGEPTKLKKLRGRIPGALCDVIVKMMAKKPADRYQSAEDVIDALSPWLPATSTGSIVQGPVTESAFHTTSGSRAVKKRAAARPWWKQTPALVGGGVLAAALLVGLGVLLAGGDGKPVANAQGLTGQQVAPPAAPAVAGPTAPAGVGRFRPIPFGAAANTPATGPMFLGADTDKFLFSSWGTQTVHGVPFTVPDPNDTSPSIIVFQSPHGKASEDKPRTAQLPVRAKVKTFHFLSGISAWGWPWGGYPGRPETATPQGTVTLVVRLHYADGMTEDHEWRNGEHFADFIKRIDVPASELALMTSNGRQVRYLSVTPARPDQSVESIEFRKGDDDQTSPVVIAVTADTGDGPPVAAGPPAAGPASPPPAATPAARPAAVPVAVGRFSLLPLGAAATASARGPLFSGAPQDKLEFEESGTQTVLGVPFTLPDPNDPAKNVVTLYSPLSDPTKKLPRSVRMPVNAKAHKLHFLSGISAWGWPWGGFAGKPETETPKGATTLTVRLHYADGQKEDHDWKNGEHFADFFKRTDVESSEFALLTRNERQVRYIALTPGRPNQVIAAIEFEKGLDDTTCPAVVAVTLETAAGDKSSAAPAAKPDRRSQPAPAQPAVAANPTAPKTSYVISLESAANATAADVGDSRPRVIDGVRFELIDPKGASRPNAVRLPATGDKRSVSVSSFLPARTVNVLASAPLPAGTPPDRVVARLRLNYANGSTEQHEWRARELSAGPSKLMYSPKKPDVIQSFELSNESGSADLLVLAASFEPLA